MDQPLLRLAEASGLQTTGSHEWPANVDEDIKEFITSVEPRALFVVEQEDGLIIGPPPRDNTVDQRVLVIVKPGGSLPMEKWDNHVASTTVPLTGAKAFNYLHSLLSQGLLPIFDSQPSNASAQARHKLVEAEQALAQLLRHTQVAFVDLSKGTAAIWAHEVLEKLKLSNGEENIEEASSADLNKLQSVVNMWKQQVVQLTSSDRDINEGTASDEIGFWVALEAALRSVQEQLGSPLVTDVWVALERNKRFHATHNFTGDTGLSDALTKVQGYTQLLFKDLPLGELLAASNIDQLVAATDAIFLHINKKLRASGYPTQRCVTFVEAIGRDFGSVLMKISDSELENILDDEFDDDNIHIEELQRFVYRVRMLVESAVDATEVWDSQVRDFATVARDLMRRRTEKFFVFRVENSHSQLISRMKAVDALCEKHFELRPLLSGSSVNVEPLDKTFSSAVHCKNLLQIDQLEWHDLELQYSRELHLAEKSIAENLLLQLTQASDDEAQLFSVLARHKSILGRPEVRVVAHRFQNVLLESTARDVKAVERRVQNLPSIEDNIVQRIVHMHQLRLRIEEIKNRLTVVLGSEWRHHNEGAQIGSDCDALDANMNPQKDINIWSTHLLEFSNNNLDNQVNSRFLFDVDKDRNLIVKGRLRHSLNDLRSLKALGYRFEPAVGLAAENNADHEAAFARLADCLAILNTLIRTISLYPRISKSEDVIQHSHQVMAFIRMGLTKVTWHSAELAEFVTGIEKALSLLDSRVVQLAKTDANISEELSNSAAKIQDTKRRVSAVLESITSLKYSEAVMSDLNTVICNKITQMLLNWKPSVQVHRVELSNQAVQITPEIVSDLSIWFAELNEVVSPAIGTTNELIEAYSEAVSRIWGAFESANSECDRWLQLQSLWDLDIDDTLGEYGDRTELLLEMLQELLYARKMSSKRASESHISLDTSDIRVIVESKCDAWQSALTHRISEIVYQSSIDLFSQCKKVRKDLEIANLDFTGLLSGIKFVAQAQITISSMEQMLSTLSAVQSLLTKSRFTFPKGWIKVEQMEHELKSLQLATERRTSDLRKAKPRLLRELESRTAVLVGEFEQFRALWIANKPLQPHVEPEVAMKTLNKMALQAKELKKSADDIGNAFGNLDPERQMPQKINQLRKESSDWIEEIERLKSGWADLATGWRSLKDLGSQLFFKVNAASISLELRALDTNIQEFPDRTKQLRAFARLSTQLSECLSSIEKISLLRQSSAIQMRHILKLVPSLNKSTDDTLQLQEIWTKLPDTSLVSEIVETAEGEYQLSRYLETVNTKWQDILLKGSRGVIHNLSEVLQLSNDHLVAFTSMRASPYFPAVAASVLDWERRLGSAKQCFDQFVDMQQQYVYLKGIFLSNAVAAVMPSESRRFRGVADEFEHIYSKSEGRPALEVAGIPRLSSFMSRLINQFTSLHRSLSGFLETQRRRFPRLYFVGDDDLLEIVGSEIKIWGFKHLNSIFPGVRKLEGNYAISPEGEKLPLISPFSGTESHTDNVELLLELEKSISIALKQAITDAIDSLSEAWPNAAKFSSWVNSMPVQAAIVALREQWSRHITESEDERKIRYDEYESLLQWLSSSGDNSMLWIRRRESLMAELTYEKNSLSSKYPEMLIKVQTKNIPSGESSDNLPMLLLCCGTHSWNYGFEYLGVPEPLVRTQITDDLYFSAISAIAQGKGGSIIGPAGTGKTETIKSLGALSGARVVVFNCDDQFDFLTVSRAMEGCAATRSWACFDEFNRLSREVLSSVAQVVSDGVRMAPVFVTMNPGYSGRTTLPPNMRSQFREFVLDHPDSQEIARVLLSAHGKVAPETADAAVKLLNSMSSKASKQQHYDWGLRALKGVLRVCQMINGQMRFACEIAVRPRLTPPDKELFDHEINKLLPQSRMNQHDPCSLNTTLLNSVDEIDADLPEQLRAHVTTLNLFCQLYTGVMLLGPSGCGKSSIRKALVQACQGESIVIDPSATSKTALLGRLDSITREWYDGLISRLFRRILNNLRGEQSKQWFLIFDGEIDPDWAEALNSVLDGTHQLTLASGEILPVPSQVHIIFETNNLKAATPATVSRCGIICIPEFSRETNTSNNSLSKALDGSRKIKHYMGFMEARVLQTLESLNLGNPWLSMIWALAGDSDEEGRLEMSNLLRAMAPKEAMLPSNGSLTDYYVSELTGRWHSWNDSIGMNNDLTSDAVVRPDIVISTADTAAHDALLQAALNSRRPLLLVGPPGSGKTMTLFNALRQLPQVALIPLNFSSNATPDLVIQALEMHCEYIKGSDGSLTLAPSGTQWAALFIDEINLPQPIYGADSNIVPVIQFLRHLVEYSGFYDHLGNFVKVERVQLVAACNPPPQRRSLPSSFLRHLAVVYVGYPSGKSLNTIYNSLMRTFGAESLVQPMLDVYNKLSSVSPAETWTPRELTRWMRSIYTDWTATSESSRTPELLSQLWLYEGQRVLSDRLDSKGKAQMKQLLDEYCPTKFNDSHILNNSVWTYFMTQRPKFIHLYELREFLSARLNVFVEEAAGEGDSHIVAHDDFVHHVSRTDRILRQPQGHAMLVGPPSVGKTTTIRFACWLNGVELRILRSNSGYSDMDFAQDLRKILTNATRRPTCLLMGDDLMRVPEFVERMNSLLANGEVPGLFSNSEQLSELEENCRRAGFDGSDLMPWFRARIVKNLHVIFTTMGIKNISSALLNRCAVNRVEPWSLSVKKQVAERWCSQTDIGHNIVEVLAALEIPSSLQKGSNGSLSFIESCYQFVRIYNSKKSELEESQLHFVSGSDRLKSTVLEITHLKKRLAEQKAQLSYEDQRSSNVLAQMLQEQSEAERKRVAAVEIRAAVRAQTQQIEQRQLAAKADLAATEPLIEQASQGVRNIKKTQLNELRSLMNPPEPVKITLEAVCLVLGLKTDGSWRQVLAAVRGDEFIPRIVNFDSNRLTPEVLSRIEKEYMALPSFTYERVDRASKAGGPLLRWVVAQVSYGKAIAAVQPLMKEINDLNKQASESRAQLVAIESMLGDLEGAIERSKQEYSKTVSQCEILKADMHRVNGQLVRAESLLSSLDVEKDRWLSSSKEFPQKMALLPGKALLDAAVIALSGKQEHSERENFIAHIRTLAQENSVPMEDKQPLQQNHISETNFNIIEYSRSVVLVIDPGNRWSIQHSEELKKSNLKITSFLLDADSLAKELDVALRFGQHLVIQHAERFDPLILPLLTRDFVRKGSRLLVNFGYGDVDVAPGFRLTLHTRGLNSDWSNSQLLLSRVNIADFTITEVAFQHMITDLLLSSKKPVLARKRQDLQRIDSETSRKLRDLESRLLIALAESSATEKLLDNQTLLHSLEKLKAETSQLSEIKKSTEQTLNELNQALKEFTPQSGAAAQLYEEARALIRLDKFYDISVDWMWDIAQKCSLKEDFVNAFTDELVSRLLSITKSEHWEIVQKLKSNPKSSMPIPLPLVEIIKECPPSTAIIAGMATQNTTDPASAIVASSTAEAAVVSMGSKQSATKADNMLLQAMESGSWLVIQNIEISGEAWLRNLSRRMQIGSPAPGFRLILTGLQAELVNIPDIIAGGRPVSIERQKGVRTELIDSLTPDSDSLDFTICYIHACFSKRFSSASYSTGDLMAARWFADQLQKETMKSNELLRKALLVAVWAAKTGDLNERSLMKNFVDITFASGTALPKKEFHQWATHLPDDNHWLPRELLS